MKNRFAFQPRYFLFWLVYFVAAKAVFLLYHWARTAALPTGTVPRVFGYGLRLDTSAAAYLCVVPFVVFTLGSLLGPRFPMERLLRFCTAVAGVVLAVLTTADLELYRAWGFRLDATPLQYLSTPQEAAASAGSAPVALLLGLFAGLLGLGWFLHKGIVGRLPGLPAGFGRGRAALAGLLYLLLLVVPLRGGLQQIPVNQSDVYFSPVPFANHAAVNVPWNVVNSLRLQQNGPSGYAFLPDSTATRLTAQLYQPTPDTVRLLRPGRPNVLFIILESFTGKLVGHLGGEAGVTPTLDSLARTGVSFRNIYAAGDRSQKGLVALLSGYPNQPATSIIKYPRKTERLPHLARVLREQGYSTAYYHGGELAFANMKSYLVTAGYEQFTERADFARQDQNSKWGAHDHVLFARMLRELPRQQQQPFFVTAFTLSSHEPFDVPMRTRFPGADETSRFRNSVYYTDHVLGRFLAEARQQPWWQNTLVVLVADHGHPQPGDSPNHAPEKFRVPLLLTGGALRPAARGRQITTFGNQTDVAATLLHQLQLPATDFRWSRDLLAPAPAAWPGGVAFYCFTDGFGVVTPAGTVTYDNVARQVLERDSAVTDQQLRFGQAYEQTSFADFLRK